MSPGRDWTARSLAFVFFGLALCGSDARLRSVARAESGTPAEATSLPSFANTGKAGYGPRVPVGRQATITCPSDAIALAAGTNLEAIVGASPPNSTFCLLPGIFISQQVVPKSGDVFVGSKGLASLDGQHQAAHAFSGSATGVVIKNLLIENYATPKQDAPIDPGYSGGSKWSLTNSEVAFNSAAGVDAGSGDRIVANYIHDNAEEGYKANGSGEIWTDNVIAHNYPVTDSALYSTGETGGGKAWETTDLTMSYNYVHDNGGPGLWDDNDNRGTVITHNDVEDNLIGILHEISWDATISNNYLKDNANAANSCRSRRYWCADININNSGGVDGKFVTVSNNVIVSNSYGAAIILLNEKRGNGLYGPRLVQNVHVLKNDITLERTSRIGAIDVDKSDPMMFSSRGNSFDGDNLRTNTGLFDWGGNSGDIDYFRSVGQEHGAKKT